MLASSDLDSNTNGNSNSNIRVKIDIDISISISTASRDINFLTRATIFINGWRHSGPIWVVAATPPPSKLRRGF